MRRRSSLVALLALAALTLVAPAGAEDDEPRAEVRALTDGIRDDLVQMNFDQALAAIDTLLARPDLTDGERGEVLVLRAQAHGAFGDFDAVEQDYAEILALRPGYVPDPGLTPDKAMARFDKVHKRTIGQVRVEVVPEDAKLRVDGV
ncbi:MAG TPA: hypothetical protein VD788_04625, partial [Candidatus Polarisedimenticolaceae bacterium]|nr:hypothetical protein [Candidatus Polarisedimenticolaceae bacterium]